MWPWGHDGKGHARLPPLVSLVWAVGGQALGRAWFERLALGTKARLGWAHSSLLPAVGPQPREHRVRRAGLCLGRLGRLESPWEHMGRAEG